MLKNVAATAVEIVTCVLAVGLAIIANARTRNQLELDKAVLNGLAKGTVEKLRGKLESSARSEKVFLWLVASLLVVATVFKAVTLFCSAAGQ